MRVVGGVSRERWVGVFLGIGRDAERGMTHHQWGNSATLAKRGDDEC